MEDQQWNWKHPISKQILESSQFIDNEVGDIYFNIFNVTILELVEHEKVTRDNEWINAMKEELEIIETKNSWELVDKTSTQATYKVKWVYRTKFISNGSI